MVDPGWLYAEGDPVGTKRYWDGRQWNGDPVFEAPADFPSAPIAPPPGSPQFLPAIPRPGVLPAAHIAGWDGGPTMSAGLRAFASVVSILKFIPLLVGVMIGLVAASFSRSIEDEDLGGFEELFRDAFALAAAVLLVTAVIGAVLLGVQLYAVIKKRPVLLGIIALVLGLVDLLIVGALWSGWSSTRDDFSSGELPAAFPVAATLLMIAQFAVAVWAFVSRNQRTLDSGVR